MKNIAPRLYIMLTILGAAALVQIASWAHVRAGQADHTEPARPPLTSLPLAVGDWIGRDVPIDEQLQFADDAVQRVYRHRTTGQQVTLWIAYSATAADRGHHPEVCMAVLGKPENRALRGLLPVPGDEAPVQRLHFGQTGERTWAFYWHYALPRADAQQRSLLQRIYRAARQLPPSVTLEVFAEDDAPAALLGVEQFVAAIDDAVRPWAGPHARRGNARLPVTIVAAGHTE